MSVTDLVALTAELIDIPSVSHGEGPIADRIEADLEGVAWLVVDRVGDNVVARTMLGRSHRLIVAGHTDTVPPNGNEHPRVDGDTVWGLGATDMKGGVAVMLDLARTVAEPAVDVSWVFYACEETAEVDNGLGRLFRERSDLVAGDAAVLAEPTGASLEAGCQGTMRVKVSVAGERAHTARPWTGRNAIHRLGRVLALVDRFEERRPIIEGCEYREALQVVAVDGGVAGNVVPDRASAVVNHRFAPDRTPAQAEAWLRGYLASVLEEIDTLDVTDSAPPARPGLEQPMLRALVDRYGLAVRAKLGWTDVARFVAAGVPAVNLGPGDPLLAHTADERVTRAELEQVRTVLADLLATGL